ncbi:MAG: type II secretion system protein [Tissierellia bacterium]|nr:type II secretion system protein [Tissierellia bacterium]
MKKAFSLFEVIIVLVILTIFALTAMLSAKAYTNYMENREVERIAQKIINAKRYAIITNTSAKICADISANEFTISCGDQKDIIQCDFVEIIDFPDIRFYGSGAPERGATIRLVSNNNRYQITIGVATGKVSIKHERKFLQDQKN